MFSKISTTILQMIQKMLWTGHTLFVKGHSYLVQKTKTPEWNPDLDEPIINGETRYTVFPIDPRYEGLWKFYKKQQDAYWRAEEIDFGRDKNDFETLTSDEQEVIKKILAFFAASDGIVNFNLRERFLREIKVVEAQIAYSFQCMMENIHGEVYSQMLESIIENKDEREQLFNAIKQIDSIKQMANWTFKWIDSTQSFAYRVVAFAIVEGVFFSGAFATIFWLKTYRSNGNLFMNGLMVSNQFISRDEGLHTDFACYMYSLLKHKLPVKVIHEMFVEAVEISIQFTNDVFSCKKLVGMNSELMAQYIKYIGDRLLVSLGYPKLFRESNPFDFMEKISMTNKTNFFESRVSQYQSANTSKNKVPNKFDMLDEF